MPARGTPCGVLGRRADLLAGGGQRRRGPGRGARSARPRLGTPVIGRRRHAGVRLQARAHARRRLPDAAATERRELHRAVGDWIERRAASAAAGRWRRSPPTTTSRRSGTATMIPRLPPTHSSSSLEAGESAIARAALTSAVGLFDRALAIAADERNRCRALVALARTDIGRLATPARRHGCARRRAIARDRRRPDPRLGRPRMADAPLVAVGTVGSRRCAMPGGDRGVWRGLPESHSTCDRARPPLAARDAPR